jgi:hypothetical protein
MDVGNLDELNGADAAMERTAVNPVTWSVEMGFNQGEIVPRHTRMLGVTRLAIPGQMVELEGTAVA